MFEPLAGKVLFMRGSISRVIALFLLLLVPVALALAAQSIANQPGPPAPPGPVKASAR